MARTWHDIMMQEASRYFHDLGLEPDISTNRGEIEFSLPVNYDDKTFDELMTGLSKRLKEAAARVEENKT